MNLSCARRRDRRNAGAASTHHGVCFGEQRAHRALLHVRHALRDRRATVSRRGERRRRARRPPRAQLNDEAVVVCAMASFSVVVTCLSTRWRSARRARWPRRTARPTPTNRLVFERPRRIIRADYAARAAASATPTARRTSSAPADLTTNDMTMTMAKSVHGKSNVNGSSCPQRGVTRAPLGAPPPRRNRKEIELQRERRRRRQADARAEQHARWPPTIDQPTRPRTARPHRPVISETASYT